MNVNDIIGSIGVSLILLAYFLNVYGWLSNKSKIFFLLNIIGAGLACLASWLILYWPFIVLEGVWCIVSIIGFFRSYRAKQLFSD